MTETIIRYTRVDKNQLRLARMLETLACRVDGWLKGCPTGQLNLTVEINANQGGIGDVAVEQRERCKL